MEQQVPKRVAERVANGVGYLVRLAGEESFVVHAGNLRESVTVLDDAVGFVLKDRWDAAGPRTTVVVYVGGHPAPVQMIVEKRRLEVLAAGIGGQS